MLEATAKSKEPNMSLQRVSKDVVLRLINIRVTFGNVKTCKHLQKGRFR